VWRVARAVCFAFCGSEGVLGLVCELVNGCWFVIYLLDSCCDLSFFEEGFEGVVELFLCVLW